MYTGAIQIQHFGSALNAHLHFHMVYINGVFDRQGHFHPLKGPTPGDLDSITHQIAQRVSRYLEKAGYLVRDAESAYLDLQTDAEPSMTIRRYRACHSCSRVSILTTHQ